MEGKGIIGEHRDGGENAGWEKKERYITTDGTGMVIDVRMGIVNNGGQD
jgi:hypothetical protein